MSGSLVVATTATTFALEGPNTDIAKVLHREVDSRVDAATDLLRRVVDLNSGTGNHEGVRDVGRVFAAELERLGFGTEWIDGSSWNRSGHLVARHTGQGPRILLIGHLDTIFEADSPFQRFELLDDQRARGPGIIDMKGGVVVFLTALDALADLGLLEPLDILVILTGDEERPGDPVASNRAPLIDLAREADFALGFEDGDGNPGTAVTSRRGSGSWELRTEGTRAHSSLIHTEDVGAGAIYELARVLSAFARLREPHLTLSTGLVSGGSRLEFNSTAALAESFGKPNVVPDRAVALGDLRPFSLEQRARVQERMRAIAAENLPRTRAQLTFSDQYPPMAPTPGNLRLLQMLDDASRDLGLPGVESAAIGRLGAADVAFAAPEVRGALDGLGLMGTGGHSTAETADLRTLPIQAKRTALLLLRLHRGEFDAP